MGIEPGQLRASINMRRREGEYDRESGCLGVAQVVDSLLEVLEREAADERTKRRVSYSLGPGRSGGERENRERTRR